jgi:hypothetical protein
MKCHHFHVIHDILIKLKNDFPKHKTLMIVSWKIESGKSWSENQLQGLSNSELD